MKLTPKASAGPREKCCWYRLVIQWRRELDESPPVSLISEALSLSNSSRLAEVTQDRVDELESLVDLLSNFGTSQDNLA
jgi:hypothetical protein